MKLYDKGSIILIIIIIAVIIHTTVTGNNHEAKTVYVEQQCEHEYSQYEYDELKEEYESAMEAVSAAIDYMDEGDYEMAYYVLEEHVMG